VKLIAVLVERLRGSMANIAAFRERHSLATSSQLWISVRVPAEDRATRSGRLPIQ
jgi:hypothetical protein